MAYIEIEMKEKKVVLEYNRAAIIQMEKMGYNAINPSDKVYTNFEIMLYGALLKHQPKTTWDQMLEVAEFMKEEYGMIDTVANLNDLLGEVFRLEGKGKKKLKVVK